MTAHDRRSSDASDELTQAGRFFLPDLCKVQPLFVLTIIAQLLVVVQTLLLSSQKIFDWTHFAQVSFYVQWNVLLCAAALCWCRERIQSLPITPGAVLAYSLIILVSLALSIIGQWFVHSYLSSGGGAWIWDWRATVSNIGAVAVIGGIALRYMYLQQQVQVQQQARLQAQIRALQSRIRPHFLFNSMNIVASLIATDPDRAERVVEDISELFRASLRAGDELVSVAEELALCKQYISIEQLRLGEQRLQVEWQVDEAAMREQLPSLTLQPLVENAVYHGIQPMASGGIVQIIGSAKQGRFSLLVSNPVPEKKPGEQQDLPRGNQIALANTVARLRAHFGLNANIETISDGNRFSAEISYSVKK